MLGECDVTATVIVDEMPSENPFTPKKMNLDTDKEEEEKFGVDSDAQVEGKKTKKKDGKKEKPKRKSIKSMCLKVACVCS